MLFILYGSTGPVRQMCVEHFCSRGFSNIDKLNYTESETNLVSRYGNRHLVSREQFDAETDFSYKIEELEVGFKKAQILDAVTGKSDSILTVSTNDISLLYQIKNHYGDYVTIIFLYIDQKTLVDMVHGYSKVTESEIKKRLGISANVQTQYCNNIELFDFTAVYSGEDCLLDGKMLKMQFDRMIESRKQVEKSLNSRRYVELPYNGPNPYIFISYAHKDTDVVKGVMYKLQHDNYCVWYDDGIKGGNEWCKVVERKVKDSAVFLLFCSEHSARSLHVRAELNEALNIANKYDKLKIFPVRIDGSTFEGYDMYLQIFNNLYIDDHAFYAKLCQALGDTAKNVQQP